MMHPASYPWKLVRYAPTLGPRILRRLRAMVNYYIGACQRRYDNLSTPQLGVIIQHPPRSLRLPKPFKRRQAGPLISIVTPSFNHGQFLERTLQSVLGQEYPRLEYIVQDGGSRDETSTILERYRSQLAHCQSCRDHGQADAINRGFQHANGDILAYLNSDDLLLPGSLAYVANYFRRHPDVDVVYGHRIIVDQDDAEVGRWVMPSHDNEILSYADYVPQETLFWRRRIWEAVGGGLDESFQFALDWDLLLRFRDAGARFARVPRFLGAFRVHPQQKTSTGLAGIGAAEMSRLRQRCLGHDLTAEEVWQKVQPYLRRHVTQRLLSMVGIL